MNAALPRILLALCFLGCLRFNAEAAPKPNVIVILADDFGYADTGAQGSRDIPTPHLDSLAKNGVRFTSGYASCHMCSPSRAGLLTGRYQQRFGHEFNPGPPSDANKDWGLPLTETTFAQRLKSAGYATGAVGKWHLGSADRFHPMSRGFDEFYGFLDGGHNYDLDAKRGRENQAILRNRAPERQTGFLTDLFGREAAAFIGRHPAEPFFLYLAFNATHSPMQATAGALERAKHIADPRKRTYAAMTISMDDAVGVVLAKLRELKLEENTLIFFLGDNGGPLDLPPTSNAPFRGGKYQMTEGGLRVPFFAQWKGVLPAGKAYDHPVISLDLLPTALAAAGVAPKPDWKLDGVDLLPFLKGETAAAPHEHLFWRVGPQMAVRRGDWKLMKEKETAPRADTKGKPNSIGAALYHLAGDIGEATDRAAREPAQVKALAAAWEKWNATLPEPVRVRGGSEMKTKRPEAKAAPKKKSVNVRETPHPTKAIE